MIRKVVAFRAELESSPLIDLKGLEQRDVPILESRLVDRVADAVGESGGAGVTSTFAAGREVREDVAAPPEGCSR